MAITNKEKWLLVAAFVCDESGKELNYEDYKDGKLIKIVTEEGNRNVTTEGNFYDDKYYPKPRNSSRDLTAFLTNTYLDSVDIKAKEQLGSNTIIHYNDMSSQPNVGFTVNVPETSIIDLNDVNNIQMQDVIFPTVVTTDENSNEIITPTLNDGVHYSMRIVDTFNNKPGEYKADKSVDPQLPNSHRDPANSLQIYGKPTPSKVFWISHSEKHPLDKGINMILVDDFINSYGDIKKLIIEPDKNIKVSDIWRRPGKYTIEPDTYTVMMDRFTDITITNSDLSIDLPDGLLTFDKFTVKNLTIKPNNTTIKCKDGYVFDGCKFIGDSKYLRLETKSKSQFNNNTLDGISIAITPGDEMVGELVMMNTKIITDSDKMEVSAINITNYESVKVLGVDKSGNTKKATTLSIAGCNSVNISDLKINDDCICDKSIVNVKSANAMDFTSIHSVSDKLNGDFFNILLSGDGGVINMDECDIKSDNLFRLSGDPLKELNISDTAIVTNTLYKLYNSSIEHISLSGRDITVKSSCTLDIPTINMDDFRFICDSMDMKTNDLSLSTSSIITKVGKITMKDPASSISLDKSEFDVDDKLDILGNRSTLNMTNGYLNGKSIRMVNMENIKFSYSKIRNDILIIEDTDTVASMNSIMDELKSLKLINIVDMTTFVADCNGMNIDMESVSRADMEFKGKGSYKINAKDSFFKLNFVGGAEVTIRSSGCYSSGVVSDGDLSVISPVDSADANLYKKIPVDFDVASMGNKNSPFIFYGKI